MALTLEKGSRLNLSKTFGLKAAILGLGWDPKKFDSQEDFDLDATAFVLEEDGTPFGKVITLPKETDGWVCYYNQPNVGNGAVEHMGDNRTGGGAGDDETIKIDFTKLPAQASRIAVVVTIHEAGPRKQNFGRVDSAFVKIYDETGGKELAMANLSDDASTSTAQMFVEFKKNAEGQWVLQVIGEGFNKGLGDFFHVFKVPGF